MKVGTHCSNKSNVITGIPQGSILGPILFAICMNDLPNSLTSQCKMFADVKIYSRSFNHGIEQMDITNMLKWSSNWCLYFNTNKCNVLHSREKNTDCDYFMSIGDVDYKLNNSQTVKDLGVTFDPKLNLNHNINEVTHKETKILGVLKRSFLFLNIKNICIII